jgi:hypothetical protein
MTRRLRAGDIVEVRSLEEILATLDSNGALEAMPFMPEMVKYCGKRFRVAKRAHKTCNTVDNTGGARVREAVHLENVRCDGAGHGGCQASCLMFWKEAWLKPVRDRASRTASEAETSSGALGLPQEWSRRANPAGGDNRIRYRCQITEIPKFTTLLPWWDIRQYIEDVASGNVGLAQFLRGMRFSIFRAIVHSGHGYRVVRASYNWIQRLRGGSSFPFVTGTLKKTPHHELHLKPGEWVRVKSFEEIVATLDVNSKNRGLGFDTSEMRLHCKKEFRVKARIDRIINERTGEMTEFHNPCVTLDGVYCTGETTNTRVFCPRAITPYWREIWLERLGGGESGNGTRA